MCRGGTSPFIPNPASIGAMKALKIAYDEKVLPTEKRHLWEVFDTPPIEEPELNGKPTILLLGQYSVGKTSFINYLLNGSYPGADIGPEPTTDIFAHVSYSENEITLPGTTLASDKNYQFRSLRMFGDVFLNKLRATNFNAELLKYISIIDTPGILTGDKQVAARGYDFASIIKFLANKVDLIFLMFDAAKLDISDEYKQVIEILQGHEEKIKIVLNKADSVRPRELIHVRGALMWALGKIMKCPEVPKVYIGSFWPYWSEKNVLFRGAIQEDLDALLKDIAELPNTYHVKRINDLVRRARNVRLHSYIMDEIIRSKAFFQSTKDATDTMTIPSRLFGIYLSVARKRNVVLNDFPNPEVFHNVAKTTSPKNWNKLDARLDKLLASFIDNDVAPLIDAAIKEDKITIKINIPPKTSAPAEKICSKTSLERGDERNGQNAEVKPESKKKEEKNSKQEKPNEKDKEKDKEEKNERKSKKEVEQSGERNKKEDMNREKDERRENWKEKDEKEKREKQRNMTEQKANQQSSKTAETAKNSKKSETEKQEESKKDNSSEESKKQREEGDIKSISKKSKGSEKEDAFA